MSGKDILFLAHRLPWPPDRGDRIRSWHVFEALTKLRPVHVIAPVDSFDDLRHVARVERLAASVTTAARRGSKSGAVFASFLNGLPASVALFDVPELRTAAARLLARGKIGTIYAYSGQMARYVPDAPGARFVMDFVDMDSAKFAEQGAKAHGLMGIMLRREARRLRAFEIATARRANTVLFASEAEAALFGRETGCEALGVSNGVDAIYFSPKAVLPAEAPRPLIVFTGQMDYAPNVEAVTDFARNVLPRLPDAHFAIVGRNPTAAVRALAGPAVTVTGEVPDTRPWLAAADVVVAPLKLARGVQNKVLEAMAMGKPVVASPGAAEGLEVEHGRDLLIAEGVEAQTAVAALLVDPAKARAIGDAARVRVVSRYSWDARLAPLASMIL